MAVTVHLPQILSRHADGAQTLAVEGETVGAVLATLEGSHPDLGRRIREATEIPNPFLTLYLNDDDLRFVGGLEARVKTGDDLSIVSAIAGG